jgi:hypothetical protein
VDKNPTATVAGLNADKPYPNIIANTKARKKRPSCGRGIQLRAQQAYLALGHYMHESRYVRPDLKRHHILAILFKYRQYIHKCLEQSRPRAN